ncbi:MAG: hypothetical protein KZQ88_14330 [Candidatus Thiodiazotropha sp. (ex Dulcina madagascariensis)]|nr:hypothetical protein [Candidatus Thiodiazotropha sp. (ex Dulcina madagascariensis)]MCU7927906.1 hypothetical protein [Candidatus Thiodiazotropha sp. (ex Dulcina madagascariensis)]
MSDFFTRLNQETETEREALLAIPFVQHGVAKRIADSIRKDRKEVYLGFPESLFVRVNALLPRLVDGAMRKQNAKMMEFAKQGGRP